MDIEQRIEWNRSEIKRLENKELNVRDECNKLNHMLSMISVIYNCDAIDGNVYKFANALRSEKDSCQIILSTIKRKIDEHRNYLNDIEKLDLDEVKTIMDETNKATKEFISDPSSMRHYRSNQCFYKP